MKRFYEGKFNHFKQKKNDSILQENIIIPFQTSLFCLFVAFAFIKLDKKNPLDAFTISMIVLSVLFVVAGVVECCAYLNQLKKFKD